jgi:hypothetical protein
MQRHYENAGEFIKHNIIGIFQAEFIKHVSFKGQSGNMKFVDTAVYNALVGKSDEFVFMLNLFYLFSFFYFFSFF